LRYCQLQDFWNIDYYDQTLTKSSDVKQTVRVSRSYWQANFDCSRGRARSRPLCAIAWQVDPYRSLRFRQCIGMDEKHRVPPSDSPRVNQRMCKAKGW